MNRLETVAPDLDAALRTAELTACRRAAVAAAEFAAKGSGLVDRDSPVSGLLKAIRNGEFGDTSERGAVAQLVDELDDIQWRIQEAVTTGLATTKEHLLAFSKARAASAAFFAAGAEPREAALEATYEASASSEDLTSLRRVVLLVLQ